MNLGIKHLWLHKCPKKWYQYTLIALVITIIVLLILAGISISMLTGENGLLTKAADSKTKTKIGEIKEAADLIRGEYLVNNNGKQPTSRYIIEKLIEQDKIDSSQVSDYGDDTGTGVISVEGENISIIGGTDQSAEIYLADNSNIKKVIKKGDYISSDDEESIPETYLYILKESGNLFKYRAYNETGIIEPNQLRFVDSDVKEITDESLYLKNDGSLYDFKYGMIMGNVKEFNSRFCLTNDNQLFIHSWDPHKIADSVKEGSYSEYAYATTNNEVYTYYQSGDEYISSKVLDGIKKAYSGAYITNSDELYKVDGSRNLVKIADNVSYVKNGYYVTSDYKLYLISNNNQIASDVKEIESDFYLTNTNHLKDRWNNRIDVENVKSFKEFKNSGVKFCAYTTNDNREYYIRGTRSSVEMPQYEKFEEGYYMKNNKLFILNSIGETPIKDNVVSFGAINANRENYWCQFSDKSVYYDIIDRMY